MGHETRGLNFETNPLTGRGQVQTSDVNTTFCMYPSDAMPLQRILHVSVEYFMYPSNLILYLSVESAVFARTCSAELDLRHGSSMSIPRNPRRPSCAACGSGIVIHDTCRWSSHPIILVSPPGATRAHLFTLSYTKCAYPSAPFSIPPRASKCFNRTLRLISHDHLSHTPHSLSFRISHSLYLPVSLSVFHHSLNTINLKTEKFIPTNHPDTHHPDTHNTLTFVR
jgi:hypothetical protein